MPHRPPREWSISSIGGAVLAAAAVADVDKSLNGMDAYDDEGQTPKTLLLSCNIKHAVVGLVQPIFRNV